MGLEGIIPPEIGNISFLVSLNMHWNFFYGDLPKELGHLQWVKDVDLSHNNLGGDLPMYCFWNMTRFEKLNLNRNNFSGMILPLE